MNKQKSKQQDKDQSSGLSKYEKMSISRLRTNTVEFASTIRGLITDSNAGGTTAQSYSFFLNYPTYYRNPGGTIAQMTTVAGLISDEKSVFDEYKVSKLVLKYLPWCNAQIRVNTAVAYTAPSDPTLIMSVDLDDSAGWSTNQQALGSQNSAVYSSYANKIPKITMLQHDKLVEMQWLNFQAIVPNQTTPPDPNNPVKLASIKVRKFGYQLAATAEGSMYAEWTVIFKGSYTLN